MANISNITLPSGSSYDIRALAIPFGQLDSTSTATVMTATVPGINSLYDGVCVYLRNGVVTSASGFTININGLGAKPVYNTMAATTAITTTFNINYTMLFIYNSSRVSGGCWDMYYGYNSDTNTLAYNVRLNSANQYITAAALYRYKLLLTVNETTLLPTNSTNQTNATNVNKTMTTAEFDPFGEMYLYYSTTTVSANGTIASSTLYSHFESTTLSYFFNVTSNLTAGKAVYMVAVPQANGKAKLHTTPYTQTLPTSDDGLIYIYLGQAFSTTQISLHEHHPVYWYKNGGVRHYTPSRETTATATLTASAWSNGTYSFESTYPVASYDIEVEPNGDSLTAEQLEAWSNAQIVGSATTNALKAMGTVPTVNIPVILKVVPK